LIKEGHQAVFIDIRDERLGVLKKMLEKESIEMAFIALHGRFGEDGTVQRFLDGLAIPYTGSGPEASRLALDKLASKQLFTRANIRVPPYTVVQRNERIDIGEFGLPVVIKPQCEGSSIGLSIVRDVKDLPAAVQKAHRYSEAIIIEKYIKGREITVGILDDKPLCAIQIQPRGEFYDYEAKYTSVHTKYLVPAPIKHRDSERCCQAAKLAHAALRCKGFSRVDMIIDEAGDIYVLELNTIPGLTTTSLLPKAAQHAGLSFNQLCNRMVELALP
jgi:D-alanine-D-alanine ligase